MHRKARIDDFHRRITRARNTIGVNRIEFSNPFGVGDNIVIDINSPVVIFGPNGAGKTRFLNAIGNKSENRVTFHNTIVSIEDGVDVAYYSPSDVVVNVISKIESSIGKYDEASLNDILNEEAPYDFNVTQLGFVNYVLSSNFDSIQVYEISAATTIDAELRDAAEDDDDDIVPYFMVNESGNVRKMTGLSHGEIYCIHFIWMFTVKCPHGILLIDEPETYLYPVAQNRFIDVLTCISCEGHERPRQSILATHSKHIIEQGKSSNIINMYKRDGENYFFMTADSQDHRDKMLDMGLRATKPLIIFVEDAKARLFLRMIIDKCGDDRLKNLVKIYFASSDGHSVLTNFPSTLIDFNEFVVILAYDADAVDQINANNRGISITLPGVRNPEEDIIAAIRVDGGFDFVNKLSQEYNRAAMFQAVNECLAINHHDFFVELARRLNENEVKIFELLLEYWLSVDENKAQSERFCRDLEGKYCTNAV